MRDATMYYLDTYLNQEEAGNGLEDIRDTIEHKELQLIEYMEDYISQDFNKHPKEEVENMIYSRVAEILDLRQEYREVQENV